jgi:hypothetical protein
MKLKRPRGPPCRSNPLQHWTIGLVLVRLKNRADRKLTPNVHPREHKFSSSMSYCALLVGTPRDGQEMLPAES